MQSIKGQSLKGQILRSWKSFKAAILNLGYEYPQGYASTLQGVHEIQNLLKMSPFQSLIYIRQGRKGVR
jgi:hypothetical protein